MRYLRNTKAFSLIELLIYISILSIVLLAAMNGFSVFIKSKSKAVVRSEMRQNIQFAAQKIAREVKKGSSATIGGSCNLNSLIIDGSKTFSVDGSNVLNFDDGSGAVPIISGDVLIEDSGTCLFQIVSNPGSAKPVVQINLKMKYNDKGRPDMVYSEEVKTAVSLR